jgi:hypothetical protein
MTKEERKEYNKQYYLNNKEKICSKVKEYRDNNEEKVKLSKKKYNQKNNEKIVKYQKDYRIKNNHKLKEYDKIRNSNENRKIKRREYRLSEEGKNQRRKTRKKTIYDIWRNTLHNSIKRLGKTKENDTIELLNYSAIDLKNHIEKQFIDGMTWDNHGEWHIDHIKPLHSFDDDTHISVVNALYNLQPLWATTRIINGVVYEGNLNKGKKINK